MYKVFKFENMSFGYKSYRRVLKNINEHIMEKTIYYLAYELVEQNTGYIDQNIIKNC